MEWCTSILTGLPGPALLHHLLDCSQEVGRLILLDLKVCIPGDPERVRGNHVKPGEEQVKVCGNHLFQQDKMDVSIVIAGAIPGLWYAQEPGEEPCRDLDAGEILPVLVLYSDCKVQREVGDERERVRNIKGKRGEYGKDLINEMFAHGCLLVRTECSIREDMDTGRRKLWDKVVSPAHRLLGKRGNECSPDCIELPPRCHAVRGRFKHTIFKLPLEPCDPYHEEFVKVVCKNCMEFHPFEQGMGPVLRLIEYMPVESKPAQLAVDKKRWVQKISG